tara:strand:- start:2605 stop:3363 length:759 start_codon:yes stop_codon:yes gene_type:complete
LSNNFALILTSLTLFSGIIVLLDLLIWKKRRTKNNQLPKFLIFLIEYSRSFFPVLFFVLFVRSFVFEPFRIPSGSMKPTLIVGDFIFVKKFSYGLRLPVTEKKIIDIGQPERGDVVVFRLPSNPNINYIKRVIGLPGDEITLNRQRLVINGRLMNVNETGKFFDASPVYSEDLDGRVHETLFYNLAKSERDGVYIVPEGEYFFMGDNRDRSRDSRYIGSVPEEYLVGEAVRIWMHFVPWEIPEWRRIGMRIQ